MRTMINKIKIYNAVGLQCLTALYMCSDNVGISFLEYCLWQKGSISLADKIKSL